MPYSFNRRRFITSASLATFGLGLTGASAGMYSSRKTSPVRTNAGPGDKAGLDGKRVGIIGLDTSHSIAFAKSLNGPTKDLDFAGYKVVAAYPYGSKDIKSSADRIPGYIEDAKKLDIAIKGSIEELLAEVDAVLLETNDGRLHLEQALPVLKAGKRLFIDKPVAASLADALAIFEASKKYKVPVFSSSSLRYTTGAQNIAQGKTVRKVLGADTYSPCKLESHHPDLFWYGVHGVELLFTVMGAGCRTVVRAHSDDTDLVMGIWEDHRIGTFRGLRSGKTDYGGTVFGDNGIVQTGSYDGYDSLLVRIIEFFSSGVAPVTAEETIEIYAFMEAADESKRRGGVPVSIDEVLTKARAKV
ncbi:MAG TPA: Gfo/Idh/MocA family oxidoreductase [Puia sp.]|nr:Gfo/Idh/MocA family oxidoreductase [Puia sp.]